MEIKIGFFNNKFKVMSGDCIKVYLVLRAIETTATKFMKTRGQFVSSLSTEKISLYTGISKKEVEVCLKELELHQWIRKTEFNGKEMILLGLNIDGEWKFFAEGGHVEKRFSYKPIKVKAPSLTPLSKIITKNKDLVDEIVDYFIKKFEEKYKIPYNIDFKMRYKLGQRLLSLTLSVDSAKAYIDRVFESEQGIVDLKTISSKKYFIKFHERRS